jgi:predicted esterase
MSRLLLILLVTCHVSAAVSVRDDAGVITNAAGAAVVTYAARIPVLGPKDPQPGLIVALHGINGNEKQLIDACKLALQAAGRDSGYVVLGLKSRGAGWEEVDHEPIRAAVAWAIATHHVDPRRVFALGYSHGAIRLGHFAAQAQDLFAGAVLWSGTCNRMPEDGSGLAYYVVHGEKDPTVKPDNIRAARDRMRATGVRLVYREFTGGDHGAPFSNARADWGDHIVWMDALRNARIALDAPTAELIAKAGTELDKDGKLAPATA